MDEAINQGVKDRADYLRLFLEAKPHRELLIDAATTLPQLADDWWPVIVARGNEFKLSHLEHMIERWIKAGENNAVDSLFAGLLPNWECDGEFLALGIRFAAGYALGERLWRRLAQWCEEVNNYHYAFMAASGCPHLREWLWTKRAQFHGGDLAMLLGFFPGKIDDLLGELKDSTDESGTLHMILNNVDNEAQPGVVEKSARRLLEIADDCDLICVLRRGSDRQRSEARMRLSSRLQFLSYPELLSIIDMMGLVVADEIYERLSQGRLKVEVLVSGESKHYLMKHCDRRFWSLVGTLALEQRVGQDALFFIYNLLGDNDPNLEPRLAERILEGKNCDSPRIRMILERHPEYRDRAESCLNAGYYLSRLKMAVGMG
ncbi:TPA: hypothetical protein DF272_05065 [Candidatus Falkowbacteria bacterium]|nr:hypothetical protein [Candidatus Falkowbacteria bacterium]